MTDPAPALVDVDFGVVFVRVALGDAEVLDDALDDAGALEDAGAPDAVATLEAAALDDGAADVAGALDVLASGALLTGEDITAVAATVDATGVGELLDGDAAVELDPQAARPTDAASTSTARVVLFVLMSSTVMTDGWHILDFDGPSTDCLRGLPHPVPSL